ncbi:unnamed protein product [Cyclocybe aegerita]|uniref:F-box domain-containing protein n=1 Tax=Cyclocybe aegerita TaxID=1973307 RepID=A0A8S0WAV6_CYCAE|nr:unnamed protein product [Cyclocybe aegerita]
MSPTIITLSESTYLEFPQELADHVIQLLQHDLVSLKHCSLVCRSWLYSSRIHLFRTLSLTPKKLQHLLEVIDATLFPAILPYVRRVHVSSDAHTPAPNVLALFAKSTPMLTHLHLHSLFFINFLDLLDLICLFPYLQSLVLEQVCWEAGGSGKNRAEIQSRVLPPFVDHLRLRNTPLRELFTWIVLHPKLPKVSRLDVGPIEEYDTPYVGKYMFQIGSCFEHMSFSFGFGEKGHICATDFIDKMRAASARPHYQRPAKVTMADRFWEVFGIDPCEGMSTFTSLRTLRIDNLVNDTYAHQSTALFWAPRVISSVRSSNLAHIVFTIHISRTGVLDKYDVNWEYFDEVFASEYYTRLRSVHFEIGGRVNVESVASLISSRLPRAASRGILSFQKL